MQDCVSYRIRYETPKDYGSMHGEITRSEYNIRMGHGHKTPEYPPIPEGFDHLWRWFWDISRQRQSGPERLQFREILAWSVLTRNQLEPFEIPILLAMDDRYMTDIGPEIQDRREREREASKGKGKKPDEQ